MPTRRFAVLLVAVAVGCSGVAQPANDLQVFDAWKRWHIEALDSVLRLPANGPSRALRDRVDRAVGHVRSLER